MARSQSRTQDPGAALSADDQAMLDQMQAADAQVPPPESAPQPAPETPPEAPERVPDAPAVEEPAPQQQQRMVPIAALHEERERRKEIDRQLQEERRRLLTLEERTNLLLQRFNQPQPAAVPQPAEPPKPAIPELEKDPVGHIIGTQRQLAEQLQANQQNWQQQQQLAQQQLQQMQVVAAITQRAQAVEQQFQIEHPDYPQAVAHLVRQRHQELERVGVRDAAQRQQMIQQEGLQVAAMAFQDGGNPAERIYELAKLRGYATSQPAGAGEGSAQSVATQPTPQERLQNIAAGQQQARSLGNVGGTRPVALTAQRLAEMSEAEFAKALETAEGMALLGA